MYGKVFDRFIQIWFENVDFATALASPVFKNLASEGILLTSYYAVTHPSEPNYVASVGGDFFGLASDDLTYIPNNVSTIVDLLESAGISWASYQENMPTDGYQGYNFTNPDSYTYYVRKHNPLVIYDSVGKNATRAARIRNFNDFAVDASIVSLVGNVADGVYRLPTTPSLSGYLSRLTYLSGLFRFVNVTSTSLTIPQRWT